MDEKGYAFTPMVFLLFIPIMILAISYGNIVDELNTLGAIMTGGDVTYTTATSVISNIEKGTSESGRNASFTASRNVIDTQKFFGNGQSKAYITTQMVTMLNSYVINSTKTLEKNSGREIYINDMSTPVNDATSSIFSTGDITITQSDPFGFYVTIRGGIPLKVVQKDQVFETKTPPITSYVSIEGLEDPYVLLYTKGSSSTSRFSNVIYKYPYYTSGNYHFADSVDTTEDRLYKLWDCLYGTNNPSGISPRPYYFPDTNGLSFFDRLEGKNSSSDNSSARMSTFILGDPLQENHGRRDISKLDHEYITAVVGTNIMIGSDQVIDPLGSVFYLSSTSNDYGPNGSKGFFGLLGPY
jgi:hypothetical protein